MKKGFTLVEVLIAAGIGVVAIVLATSGFLSLFNTQKNIEYRDDATNFSGSLSEFLYRDDACMSALAGARITSNAVEFQIPAVLIPVSPDHTPAYYKGFGVKNSSTFVKKDLLMGSGLRLSSFTIKSKPGVPISTMKSLGQTYEKHIALIEMLLETKIGDVWSPLVPRTIEVPVYVQSGIIKRCKLETSLQQACESLGGTFNIGTGICTPQKACNIMGSYTRVGCTVPGNCAPSIGNPTMGNSLACPVGSSTVRVGNSTNTFLVASGGKKGGSFPVTQTIDYYLCMRCN
jgi:prepilin-type N-terminal cleavage/methylation domain-containing protein